MQSQHVTRVLLGASSLLSNGAMLGPAGTYVCIYAYMYVCLDIYVTYMLGIRAAQ